MAIPESMQLGRYQLVRKIATGGMAEVFLAKAQGPAGFEKTLVIKRILSTFAADPSFVEMFLHEAKLAAQLNHPNLVQIFDFGEVDGNYFIAMEYVDGPNLRSILQKAPERRIDINLGARLVALACEGLAYAHEFEDPLTGQPLGLIHRDVSSDNLMIARNGSVKVVDFGVAKVAGQATQTKVGTVKGKIAYMPPEQLQGEADLRSDVYALGVILYELAAGTRPWEQTNEVQMITNILTRDPVPLTTRRPDLPPAFAAIVAQAMARNADQRYQSCHELEAALEDYLHSTGERIGAVQLAQLASTAGTAVARIELVKGSGTGSSSPPGSSPGSGSSPGAIAALPSATEEAPPDPLFVETKVVAPPPSSPRPGGSAAADARANVVIAGAEQLRGYDAGAPLLPLAQVQKLRAELERDESVHLLSRFALHATRLLPANPESGTTIAERVGGAVTGLLLIEEYGRLARLFERLAANAGTKDEGALWVWDVASRALNGPAQIRQLIERLREGGPADAEGLERLFRFFGQDAVRALVQAVDQIEVVASKDAVLKGLTAAAGANEAPFVALALEERPQRLATLCFLLEKGRSPDRRRVFRTITARRDHVQRGQVLFGMARAGTEDAFNLLKQSLVDAAEPVRLQALEVLVKHFPARLYPLIVPLLEPTGLEQRSSAERVALWRAAGSTDDPDALARIAELLKLKHSMLTRAKVQAQKLDALEGLAVIKGHDAAELLKNVAADKSQLEAVAASARRLIPVAAAALTAAASVATAEAARLALQKAGRWERISTAPRAVLNDLALLVQVATILDTNSPELEQAFMRLRSRLTMLIRRERRFRLTVSGIQLAVNEAVVADEPPERDLEVLAMAIGERGITGCSFDSAVSGAELRELVRWLAEGNAAGHVDAPHIKLGRTGNPPAPVPPLEAPAPGFDPTREAMGRYSELIFLLRAYLEKQRRQGSADLPEVKPTLDSLVDLYAGRRVRFLGLTPAQVGQDALTYHHANVTVLSIAFGVELGLPTHRLRELAEYAFFHDVGMFELSEETLTRAGELNAEDREAHRKVRLRSIWFPFQKLGPSRRAAVWAAGVLEFGLEYGTKDASGVVKPKNEIGMVGGILSLAKFYDALTSRRSYRPAFSPEAALKMMAEQNSQRFRPDLLALFLRFLQGQPMHPLQRPPSPAAPPQ